MTIFNLFPIAMSPSRTLSECERDEPDSDNRTLHFAPSEDEFLVVANTTKLEPSRPTNSPPWMKSAILDPTLLTKPTCSSCLDDLHALLEQEQQELTTDTREYTKYIRENSDQDLTQATNELLSELHELTIEEKDLAAGISFVDRQIDGLRKTESQLQAVNNKHIQYVIQRELWNDKSEAVAQETSGLENEISALTAKMATLESGHLLEKAFKIDTTGPIGKINGFHLGINFHESITGTWHETNCAWGQVTLLLKSMCDFHGIVLEEYTLVPFGARSVIEVIRGGHSYMQFIDDSNLTLQLYCHSYGGDHTRFEKALRALLKCVAQIEAHMNNAHPDLELLYTIREQGIRHRETHTFHSIT